MVEASPRRGLLSVLGPAPRRARWFIRGRWAMVPLAMVPLFMVLLFMVLLAMVPLSTALSATAPLL